MVKIYINLKLPGKQKHLHRQMAKQKLNADLNWKFVIQKHKSGKLMTAF